MALLTVLTSAPDTRALLPEPDHIVFGQVAVAGIPVTKGMLSVGVEGQSVPISQQDLAAPGDGSYALRLPLDSQQPRRPGTAQDGDALAFYLNGGLIGFGSVTGRGTTQRLDLDGSPLYTLASDGTALILDDAVPAGATLIKRVSVGDIRSLAITAALQGASAGCGLQIHVVRPGGSQLAPLTLGNAPLELHERGEVGIWIFRITSVNTGSGTCAATTDYSLSLRALSPVPAKNSLPLLLWLPLLGAGLWLRVPGTARSRMNKKTAVRVTRQSCRQTVPAFRAGVASRCRQDPSEVDDDADSIVSASRRSSRRGVVASMWAEQALE